MKTKYTTDNIRYKRMTTDELREAFLVDDLFERGEVTLTYCEMERTIVGSAVPTGTPLRIEAGRELAAEYFLQRREMGILNIGGKGSISVDGTEYVMESLDGLYVGRGARDIQMASDDPALPAKFYFLSYPAHVAYPTAHIKQSEANPVHLGSVEEANKRTIYQYIHEKGVTSCQLVMGFTALEPGSVWNTMPCHTHERRTEVYLYFGLDEAAKVMHFMGPGDETRHLAVSDEQAVISPMWSIHSGCGTQAYTFCWGMGGENQRFDDMDHIAIRDLR